MTQFAIFTGPKPKFKDFEFVPLLGNRIKDYVGLALTESEKNQSWVINDPCAEPIDEMTVEAMVPAQLEGSIQNTELFKFLSAYINSCQAITFIYGVYDEPMPVFNEPTQFLNVVTNSLSKPPFEIYAKYSAS
jgi:hypothetical protein